MLWERNHTVCRVWDGGRDATNICCGEMWTFRSEASEKAETNEMNASGSTAVSSSQRPYMQSMASVAD